MKIGIYGSASGDMAPEIAEKARELGREIARSGHTIITGGCDGLPYEAILGANELGGKSIGYSPAINIHQHEKEYNMPTKGITEFVFVPPSYKYAGDKKTCLKYRNVSSVADADAVVIISGRIGTMNEFTIAYDLGKNIGILQESGGITKRAIGVLLIDANKKSNSKIIYDSDPIRLVRKLSKL